MDVEMRWAQQHTGKSQEEQMSLLDAEVERYSKWLAALPDSRASGALNPPERALIKTYLVQKLHGKIDEVA